jgi:hypothetical protein
MNILTLKVGTKYSSDYVNRLCGSIKRNSTVDFNFYCYTEDAEGLNEDIRIIPIEDVDAFQKQWHKIIFHKTGFGDIQEGEHCLILDIDQVVVGNFDDILNHTLEPGQFGCIRRWWSRRQDLCKINGGFQMYRMGDTNHMWETFVSNPDHWQHYYVNAGLAEGPVNGEQNFIHQHAGDNRYWFNEKWFGKYEEKDMLKIQMQWLNEVDKYDPFYIGEEFNEDVKIVHFSNAENKMENYDIKWIKENWK